MRTLSEDAAGDLIARIYDAAIEPQRWSAVTEALSRVLSARAAVIFAMDMRSQRVTFASAFGLPQEILNLYDREFAADDVRTTRALAIPVGKVSTEWMLLSRHEYHSSRIYNELLKPIDSPYVAGAIPLRTDNTFLTFSLNRSSSEGPFSDDEVQFIERLVPHFQRAALVCNRLCESQALVQLSLETLDRVPFGAIFLTRHGDIVEANAVAEVVLKSEDGIGQRGKRLALKSRAVQERMDVMLGSLCQGSGARSNEMPVKLTVSRPSGRRPYTLLIIPLRQQSSWRVASEAAALLAVFDSSTHITSLGEAATHCYALSRAEARVLERIVTGDRPGDVAENLSLSINTVRTHLKRIYIKVGVSSQAELIREILLGPVFHCLDDKDRFRV